MSNTAFYNFLTAYSEYTFKSEKYAALLLSFETKPSVSRAEKNIALRPYSDFLDPCMEAIKSFLELSKNTDEAGYLDFVSKHFDKVVSDDDITNIRFYLHLADVDFQPVFYAPLQYAPLQKVLKRFVSLISIIDFEAYDTEQYFFYWQYYQLIDKALDVIEWHPDNGFIEEAFQIAGTTFDASIGITHLNTKAMGVLYGNGSPEAIEKLTELTRSSNPDICEEANLLITED